MQKAETNTLDAQKTAQTKNIVKLLDIAVDENNMVYVNWPVDKKEICLVALCEALKLVSTYKPVEPIIHKPSLMDFVTGRKHA